MRLSGGEKLILIMLSDLYERLGIQGTVDHTFVKTCITTGNVWSLDWKYPGLLSELENDEPPEVREVAEILTMWAALESSYEALSTEDKKLVGKELTLQKAEVRFPGFSADDEAEYLGMAIYLIDELDRFQIFKDRHLNAPVPSLGAYKRMLEIYRLLEPSTHGHLAAAQVFRVLIERDTQN